MSPEITRRDILRLGAAAGAATAALATVPATHALAATPQRSRPRPGWPPCPEGTTLERTVLRGRAGASGYRRLVAGPGEPHLLRDDLVRSRAGRPARRQQTLMAFGQLTDVHLVDSQSPGRVEYLDRYCDPDMYGTAVPLNGQYRAHDMLTTHVAESMVQALNRIRGGPATGAPLAFTISTGDNVDTTQYNELRWQIDLLDGQQVRPDSGTYRRYEGVADLSQYNSRYWHPDGAPHGQSLDLPHTRNGFPSVPGLLDACRRPFTATGLDMPWLTSFGNHDGLVSGSIPPTVGHLATNAVGDRKSIDLPPGTDVPTLLNGILSLDPGAFATLFAGPARHVTPDRRRRLLSRAETISEHFRTATWPRGHGYTEWNRRTGNAYYAFDHGVVRCLVLDTVNPYGGADGSIDEHQARWLAAELAAGSSRSLDQNGNVVTARRHDRLFVIFSHHTVDTMENLTAPDGMTRLNGTAVRDLLLRYPNVVGWINGHTHRNTITPHSRRATAPIDGGFWEVNTAAHVDWPAQSRVIELTDNGNGTLSIFATIVDLDAPLQHRRGADDPTHLAGLSRELLANDWQSPGPGLTIDTGRGAVEDRNVELLVPTPFATARH